MWTPASGRAPRRPTTTTMLAIAAGALLAIAAVGTGAGAGLRPAAARPAGAPATAWHPCPDAATVDCGTVSLPVDWDRPSGPRFDLALARLRATDPATRIGSLVINEGGPGSGVEVVHEIAANGGVSEEIRRRFDLVGFDPRGIGASHPVLCSADLLTRRPYSFPENEAEFDALVAYNRLLRRDCRARTGELFDHTDSLSGARDLDAIRAGLGEARLTLHTASYGTIMGERYAEEFPGRLRALVLDSVEDHSQDTRSYLDVHAAAVQDSFDEFVSWCDRDAACALHGQDVRALWADLLARAERGQLAPPEEPTRRLRSTDVISIAKQSFVAPDWAGLAVTLQALRSGSTPAATPTPPAAAPGTEVVPFQTGVVCSDWNLRIRDYREFAAHLRRTATIAPDMRWSPSATVTWCLGYPAAIPNPQHRLRVPAGGPPILLLNSRHDPATAYPGAVNVAAQLGRRATLLTYLGWGHGVHGRTPCADGALDRYLISLVPPAPATTCPAVP